MELPTTTDEQLMAAHITGDKQALTELVQRYMRSIYNFAYRYTGNKADAEDITQDVFIKAWKAAHRFNPTMKFSVWLYTIARHTIFDFLKRKKIPALSALPGNDDEFGPEDLIKDMAPLPNQLLEQKETNQTVETALEGLPKEHRATLLLHYQEDLTFEEIATIFKKPMNTVKSWHRRALLALRKRLSAPK